MQTDAEGSFQTVRLRAGRMRFAVGAVLVPLFTLLAVAGTVLQIRCYGSGTTCACDYA
jgi:hypothetical protein